MYLHCTIGHFFPFNQARCDIPYNFTTVIQFNIYLSQLARSKGRLRKLDFRESQILNLLFSLSLFLLLLENISFCRSNYRRFLTTETLLCPMYTLCTDPSLFLCYCFRQMSDGNLKEVINDGISLTLYPCPFGNHKCNQSGPLVLETSYIGRKKLEQFPAGLKGAARGSRVCASHDPCSHLTSWSPLATLE